MWDAKLYHRDDHPSLAYYFANCGQVCKVRHGNGHAAGTKEWGKVAAKLASIKTHTTPMGGRSERILPGGMSTREVYQVNKRHRLTCGRAAVPPIPGMKIGIGPDEHSLNFLL